MRGELVLLVFVLAFAASVSTLSLGSNARALRTRRQTISLDRCFDEWKRDTNAWIDNLRRLTDTILRRITDDQARNAADDELKRRFEEVFNNEDLRVTEEACKRQLEQTRDALREAIERKWNEMNRQIESLGQQLERAFNQFSEGMRNWWASVTGQTNNNNNNNNNQGGLFGKK